MDNLKVSNCYTLVNHDPVFIDLFQVEFEDTMEDWGHPLRKDIIKEHVSRIDFKDWKNNIVNIVLNEYAGRFYSFKIISELQKFTKIPLGNMQIKIHNKKGEIFQTIKLIDINIFNIKPTALDYYCTSLTSNMDISCKYSSMIVTDNPEYPI